MAEIEVYEAIRNAINISDTEAYMYSDFILTHISEIPFSSEEVKIAVGPDTINYLNQNEEMHKDELGDAFSKIVKKKYKFNITKWEPNKTGYPEYMLLGTDKGILAYVEFFIHDVACELCKEELLEYSAAHNLEELKVKLSLVDSDLDRPVFYIHYFNTPVLKGLFFETTEQIKDSLFNSSRPIIDVGCQKKYISTVKEMGSFDELMDVFADLKKNNVRFN